MRTCITCKTEFKPSSRHLKCPSCRAKDRKIPCPQCGVMMNPESKVCFLCDLNGLSGEANPNWKGGRTTHTNGYPMIAASGHPRANPSRKGGSYVFEHILVMEKFLGRYLTDKENVHHINGVKDDNRIENLELWVTSQPAGQRVCDLVKWAVEVIERYGVECN